MLLLQEIELALHTEKWRQMIAYGLIDSERIRQQTALGFNLFAMRVRKPKAQDLAFEQGIEGKCLKIRIIYHELDHAGG